MILQWKERKMMWRLVKMAKKAESEGRRAWVKYEKIWMERKWWKWDEEREILINKGERVRELEVENRVRENGKRTEVELVRQKKKCWMQEQRGT